MAHECLRGGKVGNARQCPMPRPIRPGGPGRSGVPEAGGPSARLRAVNDGALDAPGTIGIGRWRLDRRLLAFIGLAVLARVAFWLITDRVWEDALITVTHARNVVAGIGLTHHPGGP